MNHLGFLVPGALPHCLFPIALFPIFVLFLSCYLAVLLCSLPLVLSHLPFQFHMSFCLPICPFWLYPFLISHCLLSPSSFVPLTIHPFPLPIIPLCFVPCSMLLLPDSYVLSPYPCSIFCCPCTLSSFFPLLFSHFFSCLCFHLHCHLSNGPLTQTLVL